MASKYDGIIGDAAYITSNIIAETVASAAARGVSTRTNPVFRALYRGLQEGLISGTELAKANKKIATSTRRALLEAYDDRVDARKEFDSYREGAGRLPHALRGALRNPEMVVGDAQGIWIGDKKILDDQADHWARLAFGAGQKANQLYAPRSIPIRMRGRVIGDVDMAFPPSRRFGMPWGWWYPERGFHLSKKWREHGGAEAKPTKGIAARRYFDPAVRHVGVVMGDIYEDMLRGIIHRAGQKGQKAANSTYAALRVTPEEMGLGPQGGYR